MIAAHHIALLLLSTAAPGSPEHGQIIEQNGQGVWLALADLELVERAPQSVLWQLTDRGRVLVEHVLSLPLPELAWRMPGQQQPVMPVSRPSFPPFVWGGLLGLDDLNIRPIDSALERLGAATEEPQPPPPAPVSMLPEIAIPTDPVDLRNAANRLLNQGYGMMEVATMLKLDEAQVQAIFYAGDAG